MADLVGFSFRIPVGGVVNHYMVNAFDGQFFPMKFPCSDVAVMGKCVKTEIIQNDGHDVGITLTLEVDSAEIKDLLKSTMDSFSIGENHV